MKKKLLSPARARRMNLGGYSVAAILLVLAIAVALNLLMSALPAEYTSIDNTPSGVFTLSTQSQELVSGLEEDVKIYWIVQSGMEDVNLENLLERYESLSRRLSVTKKDPDVYPNFAGNYTDGQVYNNSLVVESGQRFRYVSYSEMYEYDYSDYYSGGGYSSAFAGEGAVTGAIDYVTRAEMPQVYTLSGHGESALPDSFQSAAENLNVEFQELSLLSLEAVPEDCDLLLAAVPQSDISQAESEKISAYLKAGGRLLLISDPLPEGRLTNLEALMAGYGLSAVEGVVVEADQNNYLWGAPYYLLPELGSHSITQPLISEGYHVLLPIAQGLNVAEELPEGVSVTALLTSSDEAYSKLAGYELSTYEKEEGDVDGPFALAVAVTETLAQGGESKIVWVSSGALLDEQSSAQVSGGNQDLFLNAISWMTEQEQSISIHAKTLSGEYLSIPEAQANMLVFLMIAVLPLGFLCLGLGIWIRRKRR